MPGASDRLYARLRAGTLPALAPPGIRVLAAVSGGPDSVALAHMLWRYAAENAGAEAGITPVLSHINHGARPEAAAEEKLVSELGLRLSLPVRIHRFDAKAYARTRKLSFQTAAREWRYAVWQEDMAAAGCSLLATAHHRGDQAETVLHRLIRGSGAAGLSGIWPRRDRIIRPLLDVSKEELLAYCAAENLVYAVDSSNLTPSYDRNRIRLRLLPLLRAEYNERIETALSRTAAALARDEAYFSAVTAEKWRLYATVTTAGVRLDFAAWREPAAILVRLLRRAAGEAGSAGRELSYAHTELLRRAGCRPGWRQNLPGLTARAEQDALFLTAAPSGGAGSEPAPAPLPAPAGSAAWQMLVWGRAGLWTAPPPGFAPPSRISLPPSWRGRQAVPLAAAALLAGPAPPVWRCRQAGDMCRQNGGWHKNLKNIWQEQGIPAAARSFWPLLAVGSEVMWIPGLPPFPPWRPRENQETLYACTDFI